MIAVQDIALPFSYSVVSLETAKELRAMVGRIRDRHQRHVDAAIQTGADLIRAKGLLGHGNFLPWLDAEFRWSERTANNYMSISEQFEGKSAIIADLDLTTAYRLAAKSTPPEARAHVVSRLEAGEKLDPVEIKHIVRDAKPERQPGKGPGVQSARQRKLIKDWERQNEERELRVRDVEGKKHAEAAAIMLRTRLGDVFEDFVALLRDADLNAFRALVVQAG